jgi:tRNA (guanine-N(7)-)-methyltransferase
LLDLKSKYPDFYRFYGRRVAKKLSDKSIESINYYFKSRSFDEEVINSFNDKKLLKIDKKFQKISLEIGFGNGEFLIKQSNLNKDSLFIGCEVYLNGFSKVLNKINDRQINNIKICSINFIYLVQVLKNETIDQIYFINPDPWPKARHNKRRIINIENLNLMASKLKNNCSIVITTDSLDYYEYIVSIFKNKDLIFRKIEHEELKTTDILYGISSYQRKAINRNDKIYKVEIFK